MSELASRGYRAQALLKLANVTFDIRNETWGEKKARGRGSLPWKRVTTLECLRSAQLVEVDRGKAHIRIATG